MVYAESEDRVPDALGDCDAAIATINASVEWLRPPGRHKFVRGYYVQDWEPFFYVPGSPAYQTAWDSYARFPDLVRITKTEWNRSMVKDQRRVDCHVVGPSVDIDLYRPRPAMRRDGAGDGDGIGDGGGSVRVVAMVRPSTPRRAPRLTMEVLRDLTRSRGDAVEIVVFGCRADDPDLLGVPTDFPWRCAGVVNARQAARLLNDADVFADFSSFQAMGLTALEAMACGAAVIVPRAGGSDSFARHEHNALAVDTASPRACLAALERLVDEAVLRDRLRRQAIDDVSQHFPERAAYLTLEALFPIASANDASTRVAGAVADDAATGDGTARTGKRSPRRRRERPGAAAPHSAGRADD
jgi:glycosyltransferase involved in cell wall biosynthesis